VEYFRVSLDELYSSGIHILGYGLLGCLILLEGHTLMH